MPILARLAVVFLVVLSSGAPAQESADQPVATPDPLTLTADWWSYIADAGERLPQRIDALLATAGDRVTEAQALRETPDEDLVQVYARLELNLRALPELIAQVPPPAAPVAAAAEQYALAEYLALARELRAARRNGERQRQAVQRGDASERAAVRRVDNLLAAYIALPPADPQRLSLGLQIMAARSVLAVAEEQQRLRRLQLENIEQRTRQLEALAEQAAGALDLSAQRLATIDARLTDLADELDGVHKTLRERETRALGMVGETPLETARSALHNQQVVATAAAARALEIEIAGLRLARAWIEQNVAPAGDPAPGEDAVVATATEQATTQQQLAALDTLLQSTRADLREWEEQSERELVALRTFGDDDANRALRAVNETRLQTAQEALRNIETARNAVADAELIAGVVRQRALAGQGVVASGIASVWNWVKNAWATTSELGGASLFKIGDTPVTSFGLLRIALILFIAFIVSRLFRHGLDRVGSRKEGTQSAFYTVGRLAHYVIIGAAIVIGLSSIGLSFSNLAIVAGALGVGIGFGLQSIVGNFVSGLILLFERSLKVGDYVQLDSGVQGLVREINVRSTLINTNDNLDILVPNSEFVNGQLINWTLKEASRRMHIPFGVAYGTDKDLVRKAVLEAANEISFTVTGERRREAEVWLVNFGDSSLDFELVVWVKQASVRRPSVVHATYTWAIETALGKHGIEIPFPQRDLHVRSGLEKLRRDADADRDASAGTTGGPPAD